MPADEVLSVRFRRRLGDFTLDVAFDAPAEGVTVLFGPSGAGKSATLEAIAGGLRPDSGRIAFKGRVLLDTAVGVDVAPERRRIGVVHQDARLFPHMPVRANLLYGWRRARGERRIAFDRVVEVLGIEHLTGRRPANLSGGERQRVAIGRALLAQPDLLLMDEPAASLDAGRKAELLPYLDALHRELTLPIVYVTHDLGEARRLGDRVIRLASGRVVETGSISALAQQDDLAAQLAELGPEGLLDVLLQQGNSEGVARSSIAAFLQGLPPWEGDPSK